MKRDHIFCGKRIDNGEWVYGFYLAIEGDSEVTYPWRDTDVPNKKRLHLDIHYIAIMSLPTDSGWDARDCFTFHKVIPESVGEFTGWTDRKEMPVFEGDIVRDYVSEVQFVVVYTDYGNFGLKPFFPAAAVATLKDFEYETVDSAYVSTTLRVLGKFYDSAGRVLEDE